MLISDLFEKRRNPDRNPKIGALQALAKYRRMDVFVSFTDDLGADTHKDYDARNASGAKIGINPQSAYGTPVGVYTYPVDYVIDQNVVGVEFGNERPFLWVVRPRAGVKVLRTKSYSKEDFDRDAESMREIAHIYGMFDDEATFDAKFDTFVQYAQDTSKIVHPSCYIWNMTRLVATQASKHKQKDKVARVWTRILRMLGYGVVVDDAGFGVIHRNEPTQAVFLGSDCFDAVELIRNIKPAQPKSLEEIWDENPEHFLKGLRSKTIPFEPAARFLLSHPRLLRDLKFSELPEAYRSFIRANAATFIRYGGVSASELGLSDEMKLKILKSYTGSEMYFTQGEWTPDMVEYVEENLERFSARFDDIPLPDTAKAAIFAANLSLANSVRHYSNAFSDIMLWALMHYADTIEGDAKEQVLRKVTTGLWGKKNRDPQIYLDFLRMFSPDHNMFGYELMMVRNWEALLLCFPEFNQRAKSYILNSINATQGLPDGYVDRMKALM
jgi:hypothetical protein